MFIVRLKWYTFHPSLVSSSWSITFACEIKILSKSNLKFKTTRFLSSTILFPTFHFILSTQWAKPLNSKISKKRAKTLAPVFENRTKCTDEFKMKGCEKPQQQQQIQRLAFVRMSSVLSLHRFCSYCWWCLFSCWFLTCTHFFPHTHARVCTNVSRKNIAVNVIMHKCA